MKINNKEIKALPLTFNVVCQLEDMGYDITHIESKSMNLVRAWVAICMNKTPEEAGKEIEKHCDKGGDTMAIFEAFGKAVEDSGFFQSIQKGTTETTQKAK